MDSTHPITDPIEAAKAIIEETSVNLFLTGKAGTGKTTFLRSLSASTAKRHVVLAPTGVAAINADGATIHSFFQLSLSPFIPGKGYVTTDDKPKRFRKEKLALIRTLDLIIIDEISMVRPDVLDAVDDVLRYIRNSNRPFGGVQLLLIGDLRQLAPVAQEHEWSMVKSYYASPYFFESHALRKAGFLMVELTRIYRQNDPVFVDILNKIRDNRADSTTLERLNRRADLSLVKQDEEDTYIRLTTHNHTANRINAERLNALKGEAFTYTASVLGDFPESAFPADGELTLKVGAKVMFVKNDSQSGYYNGMIGWVTRLEEGKVFVLTGDEDLDPNLRSEIEVECAEWQRTRYSLAKDGSIVEELEGSFEQIPLRLAWAITIHKSQGLTFRRAIIDAANSFAPGQTYVALSRCRSLDGLVLDSPLPPSAIITDPMVSRFISEQPRVKGSHEELSQFRDSYYAETLAEMFDFISINQAIDSYYRIVASALGMDFPRFVDRANQMISDFKSGILEVCYNLYAYLRSALPARHTDPARQAQLTEKVKGGARYFASRLAQCVEVVGETPLNIDNTRLRNQLTEQATSLHQLLQMKMEVLGTFTTAEFDPQEYLRCKTQSILKTANINKKKNSRRPLPVQANISGSSDSGAYELPDDDLSLSRQRPTDDIEHPDLYRLLIRWRT
ncbi:MAG: AAA family ATPase, partial [Muribaculaceae bacterium]|nr:AAA family ATPase [Muribaculaceae bacterium]